MWYGDMKGEDGDDMCRVAWRWRRCVAVVDGSSRLSTRGTELNADLSQSKGLH